MKERIIRFFKLWTLPLGMFAGVGIYLMFHYIPLLKPAQGVGKRSGGLHYALHDICYAVYYVLQGQPARDAHTAVARGDDFVSVGLLLGSGATRTLFSRFRLLGSGVRGIGLPDSPHGNGGCGHCRATGRQ